MSTETAAPEGFDLLVFWYHNRRKILIYAGFIVAAFAVYGIFEFVNQQRRAESQQLFAKAESVADFRKVMEAYPGTRVAGNAALEIAAKLREEKKYDEAVTVLRNFIAKYPEHPLVNGAWTSLAATYELQGDLDKALDTYQQVASKSPNAFTTPVAMMAQARIYAQKGKKDDARRIYQDVLARYQDSIFGSEASRELRFLKK